MEMAPKIIIIERKSTWRPRALGPTRNVTRAKTWRSPTNCGLCGKRKAAHSANFQGAESPRAKNRTLSAVVNGYGQAESVLGGKAELSLGVTAPLAVTKRRIQLAVHAALACRRRLLYMQALYDYTIVNKV